jgi:hypothetical protein
LESFSLRKLKMQRRKRVYREESDSDTDQDDGVKQSQPTQPISRSIEKEEVIEIIEIIDLDDETDTVGLSRAPDTLLKSKEDAKILIKLGGKRVESENLRRDKRSAPFHLTTRQFRNYSSDAFVFYGKHA